MECLPSMHMVLDLIPRTTKTSKQTKVKSDQGKRLEDWPFAKQFLLEVDQKAQQENREFKVSP